MLFLIGATFKLTSHLANAQKLQSLLISQVLPLYQIKLTKLVSKINFETV